MKEEGTPTLIESIEFVFRHPWLFISPIVIIMSIVSAQLSYVKLKYHSQSMVSFEAVDEKITYSKDMYKQKTDELIQKVLVGEGIRDIIKEAWPNVNEIDVPQKFNSLREHLRGRTGINIKYDSKVNLLTISYDHEDPKLCYKVVKAAINALRKESREGARKRLETGLEFLKKQMEFYRNKLKSLDEEISQIKSELKSKSSTLSDEERMLIGEITGDVDLDLRDQAAVQKFAKYDEILAGLNLDLLEAEKKKSMLLEGLETGDYAKEPLPLQNFDEDSYIKKYNEVIAVKELAIADLMSQGYLVAHPEIRKLEREATALKQLKEKRLEELKKEWGLEGSENIKKVQEAHIKYQIEEIDLKIETIKDKIKLIKGKYDEAALRPKEPAIGTKEISILASRLKELKNDKEVSERYYEDIRRKLEEEQLKIRVEESEAGLIINIVEEPMIPAKPMPFQKTPKVIWGFAVSLLIGAGLAYFAESLDTSVKSSSELRELLEIPILASIDRINTINEVRLKSFRRTVTVITLVSFVILSRFLVKLLSIFVK